PPLSARHCRRAQAGTSTSASRSSMPRAPAQTPPARRMPPHCATGAWLLGRAGHLRRNLLPSLSCRGTASPALLPAAGRRGLPRPAPWRASSPRLGASGGRALPRDASQTTSASRGCSRHSPPWSRASQTCPLPRAQ
ncbi:unnamed protein product, partial [Prorocentrum cordatum]